MLECFSVKMEVTMSKDGDEWCAHCLPLNVVSRANTQSKALSDLRDLMDIQLDQMTWNTLKSMAKQEGLSVEAVEQRHREDLRAKGWKLVEDQSVPNAHGR